MIERRVKSRPVNIETRADGTRTISGYAAVFHNPADPGTEYEMWEGAVERVSPGAFSRAIAEGQDVRCAFNHGENSLMGRTANKTCRLFVDGVGLRYEADLPDTTEARDCAALIARGDVRGSSFSFISRSVSWSQIEGEANEIRTLLDVDLIDVGPVCSPAYTATTASARDSRSTLEAERTEHAGRLQRDRDAVDVARTLLTL